VYGQPLMRSRPISTLLLVLLAAALCAPIASAQGEAALRWGATGSADANSGRGHGWLLLHIGPFGQPVLYHLPPRTGPGETAQAGTIRLARTLDRDPEAMAASDEFLYLLGPIQGAGEGEPRRWVASVRARASGLGELWRYEPMGPPYAHPPLPGLGRLIGFGVDAIGPAVVTDDNGDGSRFRRLSGNEWRDVNLPQGLGRPVRAMVTAAGVFLQDEAGVWSGRAVGDGYKWDGPFPATTEAGEWLGIGPGGTLLTLAGSSILADPIGSDPYTLADTADAIDPGAVWLPMIGDGRIVGVTPGEANALAAIAEFSAATGRELYAGEPRQEGPVTARDLRVLALLLVVATGALLVLAVRGPDPGIGQLPDMASMAEPGRRLAATGVDLLMAGFTTAIVYDMPLPEVFSPVEWIAAGGEKLPLTLLGVGFLLGWIGDWIFAGSPGKRLLGCRVVEARSGLPRGIGPWRALLRNAIKWALPPVTVAAMLDPSRRHRGDALAKAAVVVFSPPDEAEGVQPGD